MHRLYLEWIKEKPFTSTQDDYDNIINVTLRQYTDIFNNKFNLSFFKPKKDLCDECEAYKLASVEEKSKIQISYDKHLSIKTLARLNKNTDRERALNGPKYSVTVFDLQKVLTSPQSEVVFTTKGNMLPTILKFLTLVISKVIVICGQSLKVIEDLMK